MQPCLNRERLLALQAGLAADAEVAHVEGCPFCQQTLAALPEEPSDFESAVRTSAAEPPFAEEAAPPDVVFGRLGEYELLDRIGNGGMGEVFEARQLSTGQIVAVKTIILSRFPADQHDGLRQRFRRELWIAAGLTHPNIVRIYHAGDDVGRPFLVMERLHGAPLDLIVAGHRALAVTDACAVVRQMAEGLAFAHARGVTHRDIKPGNAFLTRDGVVKLLDWGLAKQNGTADLTRSGECWGTPPYAAPEQWVRFATVDARADVFSLGATLFFALTGRAPGGVADLPDDLPPALADLVRRMMADDPDGRPRSAAEVAQALAGFAQGSDLKALAGNSDALLAALRVSWWDGAASRYRSLDETGALPMPTGTRLHVGARLNRPAYLYLLWIDSEGQLWPLRGWLPGSWQPDPAVTEADRLRQPEYDPQRGMTDIPLEGPAGTETIVLLARTTPLAEDVSRHFPAGIQQTLGRVLKEMPPDPRRSYEFACRQEECVGGLRAPGVPVSADPVRQVQALLRHCLGPHFVLVRALSFANRGH